MDGPAAVIDLAAAYPGKLLKHERRVDLSATGTSGSPTLSPLPNRSKCCGAW